MLVLLGAEAVAAEVPKGGDAIRLPCVRLVRGQFCEWVTVGGTGPYGINPALIHERAGREYLSVVVLGLDLASGEASLRIPDAANEQSVARVSAGWLACEVLSDPRAAKLTGSDREELAGFLEGRMDADGALSKKLP